MINVKTSVTSDDVGARIAAGRAGRCGEAEVQTHSFTMDELNAEQHPRMHRREGACVDSFGRVRCVVRAIERCSTGGLAR